jgi:8-amino-7-oxononanoate synthase
MPTPDFVRETLDDLKARDLYRRLVAVGSAAGPRVDIGGRRVLQFVSNNYLGLASDPRVREAATRAIEKWGWGAGASRLLAGHTDAHAALEADLAAFKGTEAALVFPSGYMANLGVMTALVGRGDTVVCDRENHASIYDAIRLSGAELARYPHGDVGAAAELLGASSPERSRTLLVTDTGFSMGGDLAPLAELAEACAASGAMLVVDEAHALGVLGPTGAGLAETLPQSYLAPGEYTGGGAATGASAAPLPVYSRGAKYSGDSPAAKYESSVVTASVGTLSKALGGVGGFVAASRDVIELLVNRARPFIYTTALPAAACEAARAALAILRSEPERRTRLLALAGRLRRELRRRDFDCGRSETPIIPVIVGEPALALAMAASLLARGIFCPAIRPPTVPPGTSRLRISLTAEHTEEDIDLLVDALVAARDSKN